MLIIVDKRCSEETLSKLEPWGEIMLFGSDNLTYQAISCHPDIFFCQIKSQIIVAPNCPETFKDKLSEKNILFDEGYKPVGKQYPETAHYNAVIADKYLIHNLKVTDKKIIEHASGLTHIHVNQAYTRCNLIHLSGSSFLTSDRGIAKTLTKSGLNILYINPLGILLPDFKHGFFGGCCGVLDNKLFINGQIQNINDRKMLFAFCKNIDFEIIELTTQPIFDIGSILFVAEIRS